MCIVKCNKIVPVICLLNKNQCEMVVMLKAVYNLTRAGRGKKQAANASENVTEKRWPIDFILM